MPIDRAPANARALDNLPAEIDALAGARGP